jgi:hypothetical protein
MVLLAFKSAKTPVQKGTFVRGTEEVTSFCPLCKSIETVWFEDGILMSTRKFSQRGNLIYHDCGSDRPCRLYRNS